MAGALARRRTSFIADGTFVFEVHCYAYFHIKKRQDCAGWLR
jgi:hypothetical protein